MISTLTPVDAVLGELTRAQLIKELDVSSSGEREDAYWFKHALIQDTALSTLLHGQHKRLHRLVAQSIESLYKGQLDEYAPQLAQHYVFAEDPQKTLEYATRAGDQAMRKYANAEAIAFYDQALAAAAEGGAASEQWTHLYTQKGRAYELSARYEAALEVYEAMEETGRRRGDLRLALAAQMARLPIYATPTPLHNPEKAEILATAALAFARELGDRAAEAKTLWLRMLIKVRTWLPHEGIQDGEEGLALARELNLREQLAYTLNDLGSLYISIGEYEHGTKLSLEARELWRELDNKPMLADNLGSAANGLFFTGDLDQVIRLSGEAFQISQSIGNLWGESYSLLMVGRVHEERGDYTRALQAMQDCIRFAEQAGFFVPLIQTRAALVEAYHRLGDEEDRWQQIKLARAIQAKFTASHPIAVSYRVQMYLIAEMWSEAEAAVQTAYAQINAVPNLSGIFRLFVMHGDIQLAMARKEYARAVPLIEATLDLLKGYGVGLYLPEAFYGKGIALLGLGERDEAYDALMEADRAAQAITSRRMGWKILAALNGIAEARGDHAAAVKFNQEARVILDYIIEHMPEKFRASFRNAPDVRAAYAGQFSLESIQ